MAPSYRLRLSIEPLEDRRLLAVDLHNFLAPLDVNDDGRVTALDALQIINQLNATNRPDSASPLPNGYTDVNDDGRVSAIDALTVINGLNRGRTDRLSDASGWIRLDAELDSGELIRASARLQRSDSGTELEIRMQGSASARTHAVYLEDSWIGTIQTDRLGRGAFRLQPGDGLDGQLPQLLTEGLQVARLRMDSFGEVELRKDQGESDESLRSGSLRPGDNDRLHRSDVFAARLQFNGRPSGEVLFAQRGDRQFLGVYARGLVAGTFYSVNIDGVEVASLQANRQGVIAERIDTRRVDGFPQVRAGSEIVVGDYSGEFVSLRDRVRPEPAREIYLATFGRGRVLGSAELLVSENRTTLGLRVGRVAPNSLHDVFIDDVKIAQVQSNRNGLILFRYDSRAGDSLLAPIPTPSRDSVIRVGTIASARLLKIGPGR